MRWLKIPEASAEWAGGISPKTIYAAIRKGDLRAARIGAGRNYLLCEPFLDEWLTATVRDPRTTSERKRQGISETPHGGNVRG